MKSVTTAAEGEATSLPLVGQQTLVIENDARGNLMTLGVTCCVSLIRTARSH